MRLRIYKRIAGVTSDAERVEVRRELADRFGPPPPAVENLLEYAVLKALAEKMLVATIDRPGTQLLLKDSTAEAKIEQTTQLRVILPLKKDAEAAKPK